ncbi:MAG: hypothetical protein LBI05_04105, partial [Planctomycetaceae bacterium]|nr:hypothetical protein [Planctomycetaceae bacterium]
MMRNYWLTTVALSLLFQDLIFAQIPQDIDGVREVSVLAREVWNEVKPMPPAWEIHNKRDSRKELNTRMEKLKSLPQIGDGGCVLLVLAQCNALHSFSMSASIQVFHDSLTIANVPETFDAMIQSIQALHYLPFTGYWRGPDEYLDSVFPICTESVFDLSSRVKWIRNPYPDREGHTTPPLSLAFSRLGLYDLAWQVQLEGRARHYAVPQSYWGRHSFHLNVAEDAYRAGKKDLAWSFLMLASVFDEEQFFEPAMEMAQLWIDIEAGNAQLPEAEIATGAERKQLFLEIVERYQKINAHPRAWLFIQENKDEFDDADALIKKVQDDWLELVTMITQPRIAVRIVMYGVQLYPDGADPLSVSIPWPFPEGGLEKVKEQLGKLAEKCAEEEKDGFRTWWNPDDSETFKAKFVSFADDVLTLEKPDDSKMTVEFSKLNEPDQNYVRRRKKKKKYESELDTPD